MTRRGEVWWADLGAPRGSAPAHRRPVVVVQADTYNRSRLRTVVVVAVTTNARLAAAPGNVAVGAGVAGLHRDSVVNVTQMAAVDLDELLEPIGDLPPWLLEQVDQGLRRVLDLR